MCCEGLCCCCACCCTDTSQSCRKMIGREKTTKLCYLFIVIVFTVPAIFIMFLINNWDAFKTHFTWMRCPASTNGRYSQGYSVNWNASDLQPFSGSALVFWPSSESCSFSCCVVVDPQCSSMKVSSALSTSSSWLFSQGCSLLQIAAL